MATSDDPPFLNVGTEVSAKYRGAFCEATIKIAKKVVKCKISYAKGQTDTVPNDLIKGPLKIGVSVDVRQSDGQYLSGTIQKLTDASTYTVVFDDGDERTLRRSSLCLKGGRHYSASESLDQMPLTDPENFGTPAHFQSKRGTRRRRRMSQSSSPEAESHSPVKNPPPSKYPPEYPVGKCVFLENDRRRAGWVPGVVVPAHYVMEESEMTSDTICIRSFKDGRFFAAKTSELRDFAPNKEPLSSMLEGDIQPMYMCKPAIERAMAYLDTNELPWNMDLLGSSSDTNHNVHEDREEDGSTDKTTNEQKQEMEEFNARLAKFQEERGITTAKKPCLVGKDLDLFKLYNLVKENGGMDRVTQELKWRSLYLQMGMPQFSNSSHLIKQAYKKYLHGFEVFEKARLDGKPLPIKNKRRSTMVQESDDDLDKHNKPTTLSEPKSYMKTRESHPLSIASPSSGTETNSEDANTTNAKCLINYGEYKISDRVNVSYGKGKTQRTYEAKIIDAEQITTDKVIFFVHYNGWNTRYDEWIETDRIVSKATGSGGRHSGRSSYSKKKHGRLKAQQDSKTNNDLESSSTSNGTADSPGIIPIPETSLSYSSGSESGPIKTPKSTGNNQRRRMSSATETSTCSGSNSDNPQSPDSVLSSYLLPPPSSNSPRSTNKHPLTKQYPLSPPVPSSVTSPPRVPPILSPDGSHDTISLRTPPQEDCKDVLMETQDDSSEHQLIIKKEKNLEYIETNDENNNSNINSNNIKDDDDKKTEVTSLQDTNNMMETVDNSITSSNKLEQQEDIVSPSPPSPVKEEENDKLSDSKCEEVKMETSTNHQQEQLDAALSLIQVNEVASSSSNISTHIPPSPSVPTPACITMSTMLPSESSCPHPLSPPITQSENSSVISSSSSSSESDHEMNMMILDTKHSSSSVSSDNTQHDSMISARKRNNGGHDSGLDNGSEESDCPDTKRMASDNLDFSIDMTDLNGLSTTERIGTIVERMKDIQKRYLELKAEVTYLDRKRRRARKRERDSGRLQMVSPSQSSLPQSMSTPQYSPLPPSSSSTISSLPLSSSSVTTTTLSQQHQPAQLKQPLPDTEISQYSI